jgi:hypothetical protein
MNHLNKKEPATGTELESDESSPLPDILRLFGPFNIYHA